MYKFLLASRYLLKRRITYFAVLAVMLCVFIVVLVMTVLTGLVRDFTLKNHLYAGDCIVGTDSLVGFAYYEDFIAELEIRDFIEAVSPAIRAYGLVTPSGSGENHGVEIVGVDPVKHSLATGFGGALHYHRDDISNTFTAPYDPNMPGCVLGVDLALERDSQGQYYFSDVIPRIEMTVTCFPLTAKGALAKAGTDVVNSKLFNYSDVSQSGLARVDSKAVYIDFDQLQALCGMNGPTKRISTIHIKLAPGIKAEEGRRLIAAMWDQYKLSVADESQAYLLDTVRVQTWKENRRTFIAAQEKEQTMMTALFCLVGLTVTFIVFVVFYMIVSHKTKDVGVLKSIGASPANIVQLFMWFAFMVGALGAGIGIAGGVLFLHHANKIENWLFERFGFQLWDRSLYVIDEIPTEISPTVLAVIAAAAVLACLIGAVIPSWQAARLKPVDTLMVARL